MRHFAVRWVLLAASIVVSAWLTGLVLPGGFAVKTDGVGAWASLFVAAAVLAVLNATLGRLLKVLTLPLNCLTFGLFSLVINAAMLIVVGSLGLGLRVDGFLPALVGSVLISAVSSVLGAVIGKKDDAD